MKSFSSRSATHRKKSGIIAAKRNPFFLLNTDSNTETSYRRLVQLDTCGYGYGINRYSERLMFSDRLVPAEHRRASRTRVSVSISTASKLNGQRRQDERTERNNVTPSSFTRETKSLAFPVTTAD